VRAAAILIGFLHHYYPRQHFTPVSILASLGWAGIDLSSVWSGFLITEILFASLGKPPY
jgi:peptidoglycan/LPS O-acetylase OafA/YrhL